MADESKTSAPTLQLTIRVPEDCVRQFSLTQPAIPDGQSTLEQQFRAMQAQIRSELQPLLSSAISSGQRPLVDVSMIHSPTPTSPVTEPSRSAQVGGFRFSDYSPAGEIGIVAVTLLVIIWGWLRVLPRVARAQSHPTTARHRDRAPAEPRPTIELVPDETKRKLKQMVDEDPDQAAEIIKQWIRGAA
jgi:flagellar biosynthesis/type III secretory pathway M-ring protein FliF/YscJ